MGCSGSGKSTLAKKLASKTGLPLLHLDQFFFQPHWVEPSKAEWEKTVTELANRKQWVMDGNYSGTMAIRAEQTDMIIYLDRPMWLCLFRVLRRIWRYYGQTRPDLAADCPERWSWQFLHYVISHPVRRRPMMLKRLDKWSSKKKVVILKNEKEIQDFLKQF